MKKVLCLVVFAAALVLTAQPASAQAIESFSGGSAFQCFYGDTTGDVIGWRFTVSEPLLVDSLGVWDDDPITSQGAEARGGGSEPASPSLDSSHQVGIWDDSQSLVVSTTVTPGSPLQDDFRYESVAATVLDPGTTYTIGSMTDCEDNDTYISSASSLETAPEVTHLLAVFPADIDMGFVFPTEDSAGNLGRIGPNFTFTVVPVELEQFEIEK